MLEKGAEANQLDTQNGAFPLLQAAKRGHAPCVQALLEKGAGANQLQGDTRDSEGNG